MIFFIKIKSIYNFRIYLINKIKLLMILILIIIKILTINKYIMIGGIKELKQDILQAVSLK
jgi:hypothetical protein